MNPRGVVRAAEQIFETGIKGDDFPHIESRCQFVNHHRQHPGDEDILHDSGFAPLFQHLEEGFQKAVIGHQLLIQMILMGGDQVIGKIIVFVNDDIRSRAASPLKKRQEDFQILRRRTLPG